MKTNPTKKRISPGVDECHDTQQHKGARQIHVKSMLRPNGRKKGSHPPLPSAPKLSSVCKHNHTVEQNLVPAYSLPMIMHKLNRTASEGMRVAFPPKRGVRCF